MKPKFHGPAPHKAPAPTPPLQLKVQQALALHQQGRIPEAQALYREVLQTQPREFDCLHMLGVAALQTGQSEEGLRLIRQALDVMPQVAVAHANLAKAQKQLGQLAEAVVSYEQVLALEPNNPDALYQRGNLLAELGRHREAIASFDQAAKLMPHAAGLWHNRGNSLLAEGHLEAALESFSQAVARKPDYTGAHNNRGYLLRELGRPAEALVAFDQAIALNPKLTEAYNNKGNALLDLKRHEEAVAAYDQALALNPQYAKAWVNRGSALNTLKRLEEGAESLARALALKPDFEFLLGDYLFTRLQLSDWSGLESHLATYTAGLRARQKVSPPFPALCLVDDPALHRIAAEIHANANQAGRQTLGPFPPAAPAQKLRIGYFSADFHDHAVAHALIQVLEHHDHQRFEIFAFSHGPERSDPMRQRVAAAVDHFLDLRLLKDQEIARRAREQQLDIAVDLSGYTAGSRPGIFAAGCAPIQVSYLGFPGTQGSACMDYLIADPVVIPAENRCHYRESIAYLPHSYHPCDSARVIAERAFTRAELGLPAQGFVFACFNNNYKISPDTFAGWMRILHQVADSVLWLRWENVSAETRLRQAAAHHGIAPERLVFAKRIPSMPDHLARQRMAGLFLDTAPYNAHSTTFDALWAGLPVLTCPGLSFASRVAASLLTSIGLPELIAPSQADYEAMAVHLAQHPEALDRLRQQLAANIPLAPLFDMEGYTRHLEAAFTAMQARHLAGQPPATLEIGPS